MNDYFPNYLYNHFGTTISPSDLEADDEDTQDGDSLSHLKLDVNLEELNIKGDNIITSLENSPDSPIVDMTEVSFKNIFLY